MYGIFPRLGRLCEGLSALLGGGLATYTAVLVASTSVPVWREARRELPLVFAASSAASAGVCAVILTTVKDAGPARRLVVGVRGRGSDRVNKGRVDPESCFEAWKECSRSRLCDYTGITYDRLHGGSGIQWPCNDEHPDGTERLYREADFNTQTDYCEWYGLDLITGATNSEGEHRAMNPDGRAIILPADYLPPHEPPGDEYPFAYTTGRTLYHFHTRTKTACAPQLQSAAPDAWVEINPADAEGLGVKEGDLIRVETPRGRLEAQARISDIRKGLVFAPFSPNGHPRAAADDHRLGPGLQAADLQGSGGQGDEGGHRRCALVRSHDHGVRPSREWTRRADASSDRR